jgi:Domain of Unknown Function (DUF928)
MTGGKSIVQLLLIGLICVGSAPEMGRLAQADPTTQNDHFGRCKMPHRGSLHSSNKVGGSRNGHENLVVAAFAPDEPAFTTSASPVLYWYLSAPTTHRIEFALTRVGDVEPVLDLWLPGPHAAGVYKIDLAERHVQLTGPSDADAAHADKSKEIVDETFPAGPLYEWVVAVIEDEGRRSHDVVAIGLIQRAAAPAALASILQSAGDDLVARASGDAQANLWYDSISEISAAVDHDPNAPIPQQEREYLLEQVYDKPSFEKIKAGLESPSNLQRAATATPTTAPS